VVNSDIPPYSVAVGAPAKVVKRFDFEKKDWVSVASDQQTSETDEALLERVYYEKGALAKNANDSIGLTRTL
jgi:hypothetical protein